MSSIIDALKRMEDDQRRADPLSFHEPRMERRRIGGAPWMMSLVFVAGLAVAAGVFFLLQKTSEIQKEPSAVLAEEEAFSAEDQSPSQRFFSSQKGAPEKEAGSLRVVAVSAKNIEVASAAPSLPADLKSPIEKERSSLKDEPKKVPVEKASASFLDESFSAADSSRFALQGIRWSKNPSRCIAVINNKILRHGSSIDGARVVAILKNRVILETPSGKEALKFKK